MTFTAPWFAWVAAGVAAATIALHLLAWRRPPPSPLPTVRFAPERPVRMVSRAIRPADLALLALRVLLVLLVGFALAGPVFARQPRGTARVIVMDRSRAASVGATVADSARAAFQPGDALVVFDSLAREISRPSPDSIVAAGTASAVGSLSAALVTATRAAERLRRDRDAVEIVVVSPFAQEELDAATAPIRGTWQGPLRLVRAGRLRGDTLAPARPTVRGGSGDPVVATLALVGAVPGGAAARVVRDSLTAADRAWASVGRLVVVWPVTTPAPGWPRRSAADTAFAVTAIGPAGQPAPDSARRAATVVAPFVRASLPPPGRVVARWSDGEPAVTESALGAGCVRSVAVAVPGIGDLALTPAFRHFARRLVEPCGGTEVMRPAGDSVLTALLPSRPSASTASATRPERARATTPRLAVWLLALALAAGLAEMLVRRGASNAAA